MKLCIFVTACICLVLSTFAMPDNPHLETLGFGEYCFYSTNHIESDLITKTTDLGFSYIYHCESVDAVKLRKQLDHIDGESITVKNISVRKILQKTKCRKVSQSKIGNTVTVYGYSPHGKKFIRDGWHKINLQIAKSGETLIVGWPIILGSY